ncbi:MAG TPA: hypothetical protein VJP89_15430, partial [Pyrinomonadaceae bacterium]|nr:hypothetical protein [Pyrinomonadaceae bacterium]
MKYKQHVSRKGAKAQRFFFGFPLRLCAFAGKISLTTLPILALLALTPFLLSGCGGAAAADDPSKIKVGIVFDIGGKDDRSFNAAAWEGVQRAAKDL